jgi:quinol monooxygenase YgiN
MRAWSVTGFSPARWMNGSPLSGSPFVPSLNEQDGFQGFVALIDREHDTSIGYSMWTSAADLAASETSGNYQQQIARLGGVLAGPPVREVYEVITVA